MTWRTVVISNKSKLSVLADRLKIQQDETFYVPLSDIAVIVLESREVLLTSTLLSEVAKNNIVLFTCDSYHNPNGVLHSFHRHSRQTKIATMQISLSTPFKKRLQQIIIKNKIINQFYVANIINSIKAKKLQLMAEKIDSGDSKNLEAQAAQIYFKIIFSIDFTRCQNSIENSALNYGYTVVRGAVARTLASRGFLPCFGIFHKSELNPFNLADDIMEPFRPFIDKLVLDNFMDDHNKILLTKNDRQKIINILSLDVVINKDKLWLLNAIEVVIDSLHTACMNNDYSKYKKVSFL